MLLNDLVVKISFSWDSELSRSLALEGGGDFALVGGDFAFCFPEDFAEVFFLGMSTERCKQEKAEMSYSNITSRQQFAGYVDRLYHFRDI